MLTEKKWPAEAILFLLIAQMVCLVAGGVALEALAPVKTSAQLDRQRMAMIVGTISFQGAGLLCLWGFVRWLRSSWTDAFGFERRTTGRALLFGVLAAVAIIPLAALLGEFSSWVMTQFQARPESQVTVRVLAAEESLALKVYLSVFTVAVAPVTEELLFRGVLYPAIKSAVHPTLALWGTALFFAAVHYNAMTFLPLMVLAVVLTKLYEHTGNLLAPIVTHALFNLVNLFWLLTKSEPRF